jgi:hypothetical protein
MGSYLKTHLGLRGRLDELRGLYFVQRNSADARVQRRTELAHSMEATLERLSGRSMRVPRYWRSRRPRADPTHLLRH